MLLRKPLASMVAVAVLMCGTNASVSGADKGRRAGRTAPPAAKPFMLTYDGSKFPSVMQEARGTLAIEQGCVVLHEAIGTRLLTWRRPARLTREATGYRIEQMGTVARIGQTVLLTGSGGGRAPDVYAERIGIPPACRIFDGFSVNGILHGGP